MGAEEKVFAASVALIAVDLADAAVQGLRFGGPASRLLALLSLVLLPGLVALFIWRGRVLRCLLAAAVGTGALVVGVGLYLPHLLLGQAAGSDYSGVLATLAGVILLALGIRVGLRGRRWFVQVPAIVVAGFVLVQWALFPAAMAAMHMAAPRPTGRPPGLAHLRAELRPAAATTS